MTYPPRTREQLYTDESKRQSCHARRNAQASKSHRKTRRKRLAELGIDPDKIPSVPSKNKPAKTSRASRLSGYLPKLGFYLRKIMERCATDAAFRMIVGEDIPNFRRISDFRLRHLKHLQPLFLDALILCREAGLLKVRRLSLDGTKVNFGQRFQPVRECSGSGQRTADCRCRRRHGSGE